MHKPNVYTYITHWHCVEPIKRKHGSLQPTWQAHRFEIKEGITWRDAMIYDMAHQKNTLLDMIRIVQ